MDLFAGLMGVNLSRVHKGNEKRPYPGMVDISKNWITGFIIFQVQLINASFPASSGPSRERTPVIMCGNINYLCVMRSYSPN